MCLAAYKPANIVIPDDYFEAGFENNPNGAGFCFHDGERLMYVKGLMTIEAFLASYHTYVKPEYPALVHFRYATLGPKDEAHTHPFVTPDGSCLIHNGPQIQNLGDANCSDTREFVETVVHNLDFDLMRKTKLLIEGFLEHNKVVVMSPTGDVEIFNEEFGHWKDGCWYSNDGYRSWYSSQYMGRRYGSSTALDSFDYPDRKYAGSNTAVKLSSETIDKGLDWLRNVNSDLAMRAEEAFYDGLNNGTLADRHYLEQFIDENEYFIAFDIFFFQDTNMGEYVELDSLMTYPEYCKIMNEPEEDVDDLKQAMLLAYQDDDNFTETKTSAPVGFLAKPDNVIHLPPPMPPQPPPFEIGCDELTRAIHGERRDDEFDRRTG